MSRKNPQRQTPGRRKDRDISHKQSAAKAHNTIDAGLLTDKKSVAREKYFLGAVLLIFLAFSIYKAIVLFGAIPVPNPDYSGFVRVGRELTSLELPSNYKRVPVLGTLQVLLGHLMGGGHPILTASWLLNAIMSCGNILLLCLIARKIIGQAGIWLALIVVLNPWMLRYQVVPIAETSLIFFSMLTFFLMMKPTRWAYAAAATASMVRYEGVVLVAIIFLMDMFFFSKSKKQRIWALVRAFLASLPFLLWMLGTYLNWEATATGHYLGHYGKSLKNSGFIRFFSLIWHSTFRPLVLTPGFLKVRFGLQLQTQATVDSLNNLYAITKVIAVIGAVTAILGGIIKRNWNLLALILFACFYICVHALRVNSHSRYTVPIIWLAMLIVWAGWRYLWQVINYRRWMPRYLIIVLQVLVIMAGLIWFAQLAGYLPKMASRCQAAANLPYVTFAAMVFIIIAAAVLHKAKSLGRYLAWTAVLSVVVISQHFATGGRIGNGSYNIEFRRLVDWYLTNTQPEDNKIASTWSPLLKLMADKYEKNIVSMSSIKGKSWEKFVENCRKRKVHYVSWTHRGSRKTRRGMKHIQDILRYPRSNKDFLLVHRIEIPSRKKNRWINIFKLRQTTPNQAQPGAP